MKEKIEGYLKFAVLIYAMFMGFFSTYSLVWVGLELPLEWWSSVVVIALSALSVWGYIEWLKK